MFDKGESFDGFDRIVRVGKAESSLLKRLTQHFINPIKTIVFLEKVMQFCKWTFKIS